jgi:hypothetical protein
MSCNTTGCIIFFHWHKWKNFFQWEEIVHIPFDLNCDHFNRCLVFMDSLILKFKKKLTLVETRSWGTKQQCQNLVPNLAYIWRLCNGSSNPKPKPNSVNLNGFSFTEVTPSQLETSFHPVANPFFRSHLKTQMNAIYVNFGIFCKF